MSLELYIDDVFIDPDDIIELPQISEKLTFAEFRLSPSSESIVLDNSNSEKFDWRNPLSLFHAYDELHTAYIYDTEKLCKIYNAKIKSFKTNDSEKTLTLETVSYISDLSSIDCPYTNSSDKTNAQCIYEILTIIAKIPAENIAYADIQHAINVLAAHSVYPNASYNSSDSSNTRSCAEVISQLQRHGCCYLYPYQDKIRMYVDEQYTGEIGESIHDIISGSYIDYDATDESFKMYNTYKVAYANGSSVAWAQSTSNSEDLELIDLFGEQKLTLPADDVDSDNANAFNVLLRNATGAHWVGNTLKQKFKYPRRICGFKTDSVYQHISVGSIVNLRFDDWVGEPCLVLERKYEIDKDTISFVCLFLNLPHEYYERDATPPPTPELIAAIPQTGSVYLKWTKNFASDFAGYKVYFCAGGGGWEDESCHLGQSPVTWKTTDLTVDGYVGCIIAQLHPNTNYKFKVTAYDIYNNESGYSNVLECVTAETADNMYRCTGNILDAITISPTNARYGIVPTPWKKFSDGHKYGTQQYQPMAIYSAPLLRQETGFTRIIWRAVGGNIKFIYSLSNDNIIWSAWQTVDGSIGYCAFNGEQYLKYQFIFTNPSWQSISNYFYIKEVA